MDSSVVLGMGGCLGAFLVLAIVAAVLGHRKERRRVEALQYWAVRNRWQYQPRPDVDWWQRMPGRNKRGVEFALSGTVGGRAVAVAEYTYTTTSTTGVGDSASTTTSTHHYVLYVVRLRRSWPSIAVQYRGAMSRFGRALFGDRATAIGYEPFDSAYRISADQPEAARAVFGRELVAEHVAGRLPEWSLYGDQLLTYETGRIADPDAIPGRLGSLVRVADLIESA
ncbi:hypothetical protein [Dactylosporangium sp. CA-139066]|uniref:hypothetical protein n=1 Tax=Dactylosporangium sp. CA-139066 TaxID=3239930 RepID=UPI003D8E1FA6